MNGQPDANSPAPASFPRSGRLAGVDFGTVRVGVSLCDPGRMLVSPLQTVQRSNPKRESTHFQELAAENDIVGWVVGLPVHCDGKESERSADARRFAMWLREATQLPVRLFDERFTSQAADRRLRGSGKSRAKQKKQRDAIAAQILLEAFLEADRLLPEGAGVEPSDAAQDLDGLDAEG